MRKRKENDDAIWSEINALRVRKYRKSDRLIRSCSTLSVVAQKLLALALTEMKLNDDGELMADISGKELRILFQNQAGSFYDTVKRACNSGGLNQSDLMSLLFSVPDGNKKTKNSANVVTDASFKNGRLQILFNSSIKDELCCINSQFAELSLGAVMECHSIYSIRLYERLRYEIAARRTATSENESHYQFVYSMEEARSIFGLSHKLNEKNGRKSASPYKRYGDFRYSVLEKAVGEINKDAKAAQMHVEFDVIRAGRGGKVASIVFMVTEADDTLAGTRKMLQKEKMVEQKIVFADVSDLLEEEDLGTKEIKAVCAAAGYDMEKIQRAYQLLKDARRGTNSADWLISEICTSNAASSK